MTDDIEHLKVHKIQPPKSERRHLPQVGQPESVDLQANEILIEAKASKEKLTDDELRAQIIKKLKTIFDPEIPVNVYDLGLIYKIEISEGSKIQIKMTLTAPACPVAGKIIHDVAKATTEIPAVSECHVELVWDPPWTKSNMTEEALIELGLY